MTVVAVLALVVAMVALALAVVLWRRTQLLLGRRARTEAAMGDLPEDVLGLRREVAALRLEHADALKHLAVVRYDAFAGLGGQTSWSAAILDDNGAGVVLSSIHGRSESRTYAKNIADWSSDQQLSPEEEQAVSLARPGSTEPR